MKRIILAALASAGLVISAGANAQVWDGPEIGVQGGYGWGTSSGNGYSFDTNGGMGGAHAGWNWQMGHWVLGVEGDAEGGEIGAFKNLGGVIVSSNMDFDASVRGKLGYAFDRVLLYGTGGVAFGDVNTKYHTTNPCCLVVASNDEIRVGWTAGGGVGYAFTPNWEGNVEYRYTDLGSQSTRSRRGFVDNNSFNYNMIRVGLTYRFAPPMMAPMMAPAPMPAAAPAMAPPPNARTFLVFFDFDRYNLTPDARRVIEAAAASYKANGVARIEVSGYTDLAGTQAYNLRLSQRRADAVSGYLLRQGVAKNVLDVKWFGKEHPRVPTPDGVREPQNRRVEIVMP